MTREHLPNRHVIEDAARLGGGQVEEDTGPGYIAPVPFSRYDVVGWIFIFATVATGAMAIWLGTR